MKMRGQASNMLNLLTLYYIISRKKKTKHLIPNVTIRFFSCSNEKKYMQHQN